MRKLKTQSHTLRDTLDLYGCSVELQLKTEFLAQMGVL